MCSASLSFSAGSSALGQKTTSHHLHHNLCCHCQRHPAGEVSAGPPHLMTRLYTISTQATLRMLREVTESRTLRLDAAETGWELRSCTHGTDRSLSHSLSWGTLWRTQTYQRSDAAHGHREAPTTSFSGRWSPSPLFPFVLKLPRCQVQCSGLVFICPWDGGALFPRPL